MPPRRGATAPPPEEFEENIVDIDVSEEMRGSYLEYAYSVIYSRALPDARDGLKPVHRRILFQMAQMRLRLVDGHGNFGSLGGDDPPAAYRYTECRLEEAAQLMTDGLAEDVVDFV